MGKRTSLLISAVGLCSLVQPAIALEFCLSSADRSATLDAAGATKIVIVAGAGDLAVRGDPAARNVSATGHVCAGSDELLEQVQIKTRRQGSTLYLDTVLPDLGNGFPWLLNKAKLDLTVTLPASLAVELEDGSGDIDIRQVRSAKIEDGSGDIAIKDVRGNVNVLLDSSGALQIERVGGSVHVGQASSGDIVIREVKGNVRVDSDSSGDIRVVQVGGNFVVEADSTGSISHDRIEGNVRLPPDRDRDE